LPLEPVRGIVRTVPTFSRILFAADFSEDSEYALGYAQEIATRFSCEIVVLHVAQPLPPLILGEPETALDAGTINQIVEEQRLLAVRELDKRVERLRQAGLRARSIVRIGAPFLEIAGAAKTEKADLIVLATHGRGGLAHVLLGSVAERVVRKAPCPVLTVRHPDRNTKHSS
jgi:nucleotide-binding universal stress UspA family protein